MALKAVHVSEIPSLDHVPHNPSLSLYSTSFPSGSFFHHSLPISLFLFAEYILRGGLMCRCGAGPGRVKEPNVHGNRAQRERHERIADVGSENESPEGELHLVFQRRRQLPP